MPNSIHSSDDELNVTMITGQKEFICVDCKLEIGPKDEAIQCDNCEKWKHSKCFPKREFEKAKDRIMWYCDTICEADSGIDREVAGINVKTANTTDIMKCMAQFFKQFREVNNILKKQNIDEIKADIKKMKDENRQRDLEIEQLKNEIGQLKQLQFNNKIICYNVPIGKASDETTKKGDDNKYSARNNKTIAEPMDDINKPAVNVIKDYFKNNNLRIDSIDNIQSAYQMKAKNGKPRPIVISFDSNESKFKFIDDIKVLKKQKKAVKIVVSEFLTSEIRELLQETKSGLGGTYKFIWSKNGRIFVREKEDTKPICINHSSQIRDLMR